MNKPNILIASGDLFIVFLYGAALTYVSTYVMPVDLQSQLIASGLLAAVLGSLGPDLDELIEWIFFFMLGIFVAALAPEIETYYYTKTYNLEQIFRTCQNTWPYFIKLIFVWVIGLPPGLAFAKLTHRFANRSYYRHPRFF